jgi:hypothetical protein
MGLQFFGQVLQLQAHRARRKVEFFGRASNRAMFNDSQKYFKLTKVHDSVGGFILAESFSLPK